MVRGLPEKECDYDDDNRQQPTRLPRHEMAARRPPRPRAAAVIAATSVFLLHSLLAASEVNAEAARAASAQGGQVVTNQFHVVVKRHAGNDKADLRSLADNIATEHGFHNLGPVS